MTNITPYMILFSLYKIISLTPFSSRRSDFWQNRKGKAYECCFWGQTAIVDVFLVSITHCDVIIAEIAFTYLSVGLQ